MRESIGTVSLLNFIIFFILLVFAFLAGSLSYYKAYRVNNAIVSSIEKFEGFNPMSYEDMEQKLVDFGYERVDFSCPVDYKNSHGEVAYLVDNTGARVTNSSNYNYGYCIYRYENDTIYKGYNTSTLATTDKYDSYEVMTLIKFDFPVIGSILRLRVSSRTGRIFYFSD